MIESKLGGILTARWRQSSASPECAGKPEPKVLVPQVIVL
jgi:hypothetical protein